MHETIIQERVFVFGVLHFKQKQDSSSLPLVAYVSGGSIQSLEGII